VDCQWKLFAVRTVYAKLLFNPIAEFTYVISELLVNRMLNNGEISMYLRVSLILKRQ